MKKAKKTKARKTLSNKAKSGKKITQVRTQSKAKIQVKAKAETPEKRKAARKPRTSDLAVEKSRGVIPDRAKADSWTDLTQEAQSKKTIPRKVAGKKPIFPLGHSD